MRRNFLEKDAQVFSGRTRRQQGSPGHPGGKPWGHFFSPKLKVIVVLLFSEATSAQTSLLQAPSGNRPGRLLSRGWDCRCRVGPNPGVQTLQDRGITRSEKRRRISVFNKILVPLDGSELAAKVIPQAEDLAKTHNAQLVLLTVGSAAVGEVEASLRRRPRARRWPICRQ